MNVYFESNKENLIKSPVELDTASSAVVATNGKVKMEHSPVEQQQMDISGSGGSGPSSQQQPFLIDQSHNKLVQQQLLVENKHLLAAAAIQQQSNGLGNTCAISLHPQP